nr:MAG TPA: hypothetical protein [Caudoviricetes sp.]
MHPCVNGLVTTSKYGNLYAIVTPTARCSSGFLS